MTYDPRTDGGATRCIALTRGGQCPDPAEMLRLCRRHFGVNRELILQGKGLRFVVQDFDTGRPRIVAES